MDLVGSGLAKQIVQYLELVFVDGADSAGIHQEESHISSLLDHVVHFVGRVGDIDGQIEDAGVGSDLFQSTDTIGVRGDQRNTRAGKPSARLPVN